MKNLQDSIDKQIDENEEVSQIIFSKVFGEIQREIKIPERYAEAERQHNLVIGLLEQLIYQNKHFLSKALRQIAEEAVRKTMIDEDSIKYESEKLGKWTVPKVKAFQLGFFQCIKFRAEKSKNYLSNSSEKEGLQC